MSESNLVFSQLSFEDKAKELRYYIMDYVTAQSPETADRIINAITNSGDLLSVIIDAVAAYTLDNTRKLNYEANELSRLTVKSDAGVERLVANNGLKRGITKHGENGQPDTLETNEQLLKRFDLSHYQANTTGTRFGYKYHSLCYGVQGIPSIEITKLENKVTLTYTYPQNDGSNVSDTEFRCIEKGSGKVQGAVTPVEGEQVDLAEMLAYMQRPEIAQETDKLSLKMATDRQYSVSVIAYTNNDPRHHVDQKELLQACLSMAVAKRHNEARVSDFDFAHIARSMGAYDVDVIGLDNPINCQWDEYPQLTELTVDVKGKRAA